jgi:hypothetical protein
MERKSISKHGYIFICIWGLIMASDIRTLIEERNVLLFVILTTFSTYCILETVYEFTYKLVMIINIGIITAMVSYIFFAFITGMNDFKVINGFLLMSGLGVLKIYDSNRKKRNLELGDEE